VNGASRVKFWHVYRREAIRKDQRERERERAYRLNKIYVALTTGLGTAAEIEGPTKLICHHLAIAAYQASTTLSNTLMKISKRKALQSDPRRMNVHPFIISNKTNLTATCACLP
jgi:hypothetical protein